MIVDATTLAELARHLRTERKRQSLSREQAAAVCNVSPSFIRDAERDSGRCSLARLVQLTQGLGLTLTLAGWRSPAIDPALEQISVKTPSP